MSVKDIRQQKLKDFQTALDLINKEIKDLQDLKQKFEKRIREVELTLEILS